MKIAEIIEDMTSKDVMRIRRAGAVVIKNSQNESFIYQLIPFKKKINRSTKELELGGAFASNNRFYQFPLEIIEFHKKLNSFFNISKKCTCELYLSKSFQCFDPDKESENKSIRLNHKIKGNHTYDSEIECLKCGSKFYVSERHYHYVWWKWIRITEPVEVNKSENLDLTNELEFILSSIQTIIKNEHLHPNLLNLQKERLLRFRQKLASNNNTATLEKASDWTKNIDTLINNMNAKIESFN